MERKPLLDSSDSDDFQGDPIKNKSTGEERQKQTQVNRFPLFS